MSFEILFPFGLWVFEPGWLLDHSQGVVPRPWPIPAKPGGYGSRLCMSVKKADWFLCALHRLIPGAVTSEVTRGSEGFPLLASLAGPGPLLPF